ncbi:MAG: hypothetical protein LH603_18430 [Pseudonocardia sp.]|nr:hypothetical protein [Pseudonocardia sp.]
MWKALLDALPRGHTLEEKDWQRRHRLLLWLLALHVPALALFGIAVGHPVVMLLGVLAAPLACVALGYVLRGYRRTAAVIVTGGLVYCSGALVGLTGGAIEAHFHFFIIIGFIALYQDWAPFLFNILFVVISHGVGSFWQQSLIFSHSAGQSNPWVWSLIHGVAVLFACVGMMLFWRVTEDSQRENSILARRLADADIARREFTSDLLVNLARRNQSMLYRQLEIINQLEESERDPDALAELFKLDHLATRVRRNAENLLVLSGEQPPRTWSEPVALRDVLRAAIAETEDLDRVVFIVDERPSVAGHAVTDLTHLLAELTENAVRFSPPDTTVTIRARPDQRESGGQLITVEDWGVGMPAPDLAEANALLAVPPEVDLSISQRLGFHVIARLAQRHGVRVHLGATPGSGITAVVGLPPALFAAGTTLLPAQHTGRVPGDRVVRGPMSRQAPKAPAPAQASTATATAHLPTERWATTPAPSSVAPSSAATGVVALPRREGGTPWHDGAPGPFGSNGSWRGWWEPEADADQARSRPPVPAPRPSPAPRAGTESARPRTPPLPKPAPSIRSAQATSAQATSAQATSAQATSAQATMASVPPTSNTGVDPIIGLRRRVPQSHLAPELRESVSPQEPGSATRPAADAAKALSRYQASREAARATTDDENGSRL